MNLLVSRLKESEQDFEFYPTTQEIIDRLVADLTYLRDERFSTYGRVESVLDIGGGSGKVLCALRDQAELRSLYAIEKSAILCEQMDADIFIVGTEFHEQSLVSKQVDLTFCNPPYSEYEEWAVKIIREAFRKIRAYHEGFEFRIFTHLRREGPPMIATPPLPPPATPPVGSNGHLPHNEPILGGDPLEYVSASRLKSFLTCRLRFYFEKVLALPKPTSPSLHFGKAVHAGLQHYNKARWRGGDTSETAVVAAYQKAFDNAENSQPVAFDSDADKAELRAKGEPLLRAFLTTKQIAPEKKPMGVELSLRAELPVLALPLLGVTCSLIGGISLVKASRSKHR